MAHGMGIDYTIRAIIASRTVNEASLQAKFVNTLAMEEKRGSVLHAAGASRTWSECLALNHYDLLDIRRSHASFCNNPRVAAFFFFIAFMF